MLLEIEEIIQDISEELKKKKSLLKDQFHYSNKVVL